MKTLNKKQSIIIILILLLTFSLVILLTYSQRNIKSSINTNQSSSSNELINNHDSSNIPLSSTISSSIGLSSILNKYTSMDGTYTYSLSDDWTLTGQREGTQVFVPKKYLNQNKQIDGYLDTFSRNSDGYNAQEWQYYHSTDYIDPVKYTVNNQEAFKARYIRKEYEDDDYVIKKGDKIVAIEFRIWANFKNNYQDYSEFSKEVENMVNSIVIK